MFVKEYYLRNKQYGNRYHTDFQLIDVTHTCQFSGTMDKQARFVEENQLLNEEDWSLFVHQFKSAPDDPDNGWRGEYFGKMMRGACMTYQYTRSKKLYDLLKKTVLEMLNCQDNFGRFSTYSKACEFRGWDIWCRKYVLLGLLHFHEICAEQDIREQIVDVLSKHLDYIVENIGVGRVELDQTSTWWGGN